MKKIILILILFYAGFIYSQTVKNITVYRGDQVTLEFKVLGNYSTSLFKFYVKRNRNFGTPFLVVKSSTDTSQIKKSYSAPFTTVRVFLKNYDTYDIVSAKNVYDLVRDSVYTVYTGNFDLNFDVANDVDNYILDDYYTKNETKQVINDSLLNAYKIDADIVRTDSLIVGTSTVRIGRNIITIEGDPILRKTQVEQAIRDSLLNFQAGGGVMLSTVRQVAGDSSNAALNRAKQAIKDTLDANTRQFQTLSQVRTITGDTANAVLNRAKQSFTDTLNANTRQFQTLSQVRIITGDTATALYNRINVQKLDKSDTAAIRNAWQNLWRSNISDSINALNQLISQQYVTQTAYNSFYSAFIDSIARLRAVIGGQTPTYPNPVTNLYALSYPDSITLSWTNPSQLDSIVIERASSLTGGTVFTRLTATTSNYYRDNNNLQNGVTYTYRLRVYYQGFGSNPATTDVYKSSANSWFVSSTATGSNNGRSWENAWTSFSNINWNNIGTGDTIYISGGTTERVYQSTLTVGKNDVTITKGRTPGHDGTVIFRAVTPRGSNGIVMVNRQRVSISGFQFEELWAGVDVSSSTSYPNATDSIKIENCYFKSCREVGINFHGQSDTSGSRLRNIWIMNNLIEADSAGSKLGPTEEGQVDFISVYYARNIFITGNTFINRNNKAYDWHNDWLQGEWNTNIYAWNNFFMNMTTQSMNGFSGYSLGAGDYYVFNNVFFRGSYSNFFNIWIYDPINSWSSYANQRPRWGRVRIINNTFMAGHHGMINTGRDFYMVIWNNLMWGLGTYSGSNFGRTSFIQNDEIPSANFNIRNNRFYTFTTSGITYLRDSSLAVMHPSNAFYVNNRPNLVNVPQPAITVYTYSTFPYSLNPLDYRLTSSATNEIGQARVLTEADVPMNNLAPSWFKVWNYIQKDFRGVTRGSSWDVGAFEYVP